MLLTITSQNESARDLGFLLHKHPDEFQSYDLSFGMCHVFYPEAEENICTAALLLDIDPVKLVRGSKGKGDAPLSQYVNDRPYVASSLMSVALGKVFRTALNGQCKEKPELPEKELNITVEISAAPVKGGEAFLEQVFKPLGYELEVERLPLDEKFPDWGDSKLYKIRLSTRAQLKDVLNHLYVLIPVLDIEKHYYVGQEEIDKLVRRGEDWLGDHPHKEAIARRYLFNKKSLAAQALERLMKEEEAPGEEAEERAEPELEEKLEKKISLNETRINTVVSKLKENGARRVIDLGCGEGKLLKELLNDFTFSEIAGTDVSIRVLEMAKRRLKLSFMPEKKAARLKLFHGSLMYRDQRLAGFDAATCVEVIEHLDEPRLQAFEKVVFKYAQPQMVIITTPNSEYNKLFETMEPGQFRHKDHRFEWTREQFRQWCDRIGSTYGYRFELAPIGDSDPELGAPTQMGVFTHGA